MARERERERAGRSPACLARINWTSRQGCLPLRAILNTTGTLHLPAAACFAEQAVAKQAATPNGSIIIGTGSNDSTRIVTRQLVLAGDVSAAPGNELVIALHAVRIK